ncbi:hypothetical protein RSOLAG22IIIB_11606 [Rhizoctonia solani]|uniref:ABM domain-containing protein n=1 Tax=Rhizoctonia solani TaxID=456999 RepID=A0A0K6G9D9_9AGAM|nr:hypothetical protein RSOLAG22IIIB_11606 [Rhizoctonia solani]
MTVQTAQIFSFRWAGVGYPTCRVLIPLVPIQKIYPNPNPHVPEIPEAIPPLGIAPAIHFSPIVFRVPVLLVLFPTLFILRTIYKPIECNGLTHRTGQMSPLVPARVNGATQTSTGSTAPEYGRFNGTITASPSSVPAPTPGTSGSSNSTAKMPAPTEPTLYETLLALVGLVIVTPFQLSAVIEIKEGHADTFDREYRKVRECANSDKEPGCIEFRTSRHGNKFFTFKQYEDAAALKAHVETDVFLAFEAVVKDLHARPPIILFYEELDNAPKPCYTSKI